MVQIVRRQLESSFNLPLHDLAISYDADITITPFNGDRQATNAFKKSRLVRACNLHIQTQYISKETYWVWEFNDTQTGIPFGIPKGARCVQRFDDSLNSAIHITYRISLRSSSMREPRDPLLKVVFQLLQIITIRKSTFKTFKVCVKSKRLRNRKQALSKPTIHNFHVRVLTASARVHRW